MDDPTKHSGGSSVLSEFKSLLRAPRRTAAFAYGFVFAFVIFTVFLLFNPSPNSSSSSPWLSSIFTSPSTADSYRSQFSSFFSYFFHNSSSSPPRQLDPYFSSLPPSPNTPYRSENATISQNHTNLVSVLRVNETSNLKNSTQISRKPQAVNQSPANQISNSQMNDTAKAVRSVPAKDKGVASNYTASLSKKKSNNNTSVSVANGNGWLESLKKCDFFDGQWVKDDSYPLYKPGSCSLIDEQFNCVLNGRPDTDYHKFRWKPKGCDLPRLDGSRMLDILRGKRLVFVGDSLNRNMWESIVCILRSSAKDWSKVYEANGRQHFRGEASYSFIFKDYNCTVEFFVSPFLVREWEMPDKNGTKKETLRLDLVGQSSDQYKGADIIVFNTGHWWTHDKTSKGYNLVDSEHFGLPENFIKLRSWQDLVSTRLMKVKKSVS